MIEQRPAQLELGAEPDLRLRRVHLRSVGPRAARMDPFDLDHTTPDGTASRVLWSLTNTGGKTTLLRLITSVIVPSARAQMGGANIGEYVDSSDTSHVVLEWESSDTGRFVTAAVYEWPNRRRPPGTPSMSDLKKFFYTFRCGTIGVDDLPFTVDGRKRTLEEYRSELRELFGSAGVLLGPATQQGEWAKVLDTQTPLDPELFRYQMRMNDDESGAEALVTKLGTPDAVVRFFIQALNDETSVADFTDTLREYAQQSTRRSQWTAEEAFCDALIDALEPLSAAEDRRQAAATHKDAQAVALSELAGRLQVRIATEHKRESQLGEQEEALAGQDQALDAKLKRRSDVRQQLLLEEARFDAEAAEATLQAASELQSATELDRNAWAATATIARLRDARKAAEVCERNYELGEGKLMPLRTAVDVAAGALAARYSEFAKAADKRASDAGEARRVAASAGEDARKRRRKADNRVTKARNELAEIRRLAEEVDTARIDATAAGHLQPGETGADALQRWNTDLASAADRIARVEESKVQASTEVAEAEGRAGDAAAALSEARERRRDADEVLARYRGELTELAADADVAEAAAELLGEALDSAATAAALVDDARRRASDAERRASDLDSELTAANADLDRIRRGELFSTADDIEAVRSLLVDSRIGAVTGWEWLERNVPAVEERRAWIEARPELANGVFVSDPATIDAARSVLAEAAPETRIAVHVAPVTYTTLGTLDRSGFVVVPHQALWDRDGLEELRQSLEQRSEDLAERLHAARSAGETYRQAAGALDAFARRWADTDEAQLVDAASAAAETETSATKLHEARSGELATAREQLQGLQEELVALATSTGTAQVAAATCERISGLEERSAEANNRRPGVEERLARAQGEVADADDAERAANEAVNAAVEQAASARADAQRFRELQADIGAEPDGTVDDRPLVDLESEWRSLRNELTAAEAGSDHAARLEQARQHLGDARAESDALDADASEGAEERLARLEGASVASRAEELRRAEIQLAAANRAFAQAQIGAETADRLVAEREPDDRQVYAVLSVEWTPKDRDHTIALLEQLDGITTRERAELNELRAKLQKLRHQLERVRNDIDRLQLAFDRLDAEPAPGLPAFTGTVEDADSDARGAVAEHRQAVTDHQLAYEAWRAAMDDLRAEASDPRWASIATPVKQRCMNGAAEEVAGDARETARSLQLRVASLRADLEELNKHRHALVMTLEDLCRTQLRLLAEVTSCSRLPDGLDDMSGHPAFKIDFERADPAEARGRLAARVDRWAEILANDPKAAGRGEQRWVWLADAARDLVVDRPRAGAWSVQVLKPVIDGTVEYRTPDRIEIEFSGGQELTLAVLLYCTLSKVRAQNRTGGSRPPGVLLLDNPFGKASNATLIRIQQALATRSGLQLVCATGLADPSVKTAFDGDGGRVLELRNDRDQRHGLQYLRLRNPSVAPVVHAAVAADRALDDPDGHLHGVAYSVRRS